MEKYMAFGCREELDLGSVRNEDGSENLGLPGGITLHLVDAVRRSMIPAEVDETRHPFSLQVRLAGSTLDPGRPAR